MPFWTAERVDGPTSVYVISAGEWAKIGLATDIAKRLVALQNACPLRLAVVGSLEFESFAVARRVEKSLHARFAVHRGFGEWFGVPAADALEALMEHLPDRYVRPEPPEPTPRPTARFSDMDLRIMKALTF